MKSPCIAVCQIDKQTNMCVGCYRTMDEIMQWRTLTDDERDVIMHDIPQRKARLEDNDDSDQSPLGT